MLSALLWMGRKIRPDHVLDSPCLFRAESTQKGISLFFYYKRHSLFLRAVWGDPALGGPMLHVLILVLQDTLNSHL